MTPRTEPSPAALVRFRWRRTENAKWVDVDGRRILVGWNAADWYEPLRSEPALFREFAVLSDEPEALAGFAAAFGDLGAAPPTPAPNSAVDGLGCSLEYWRGQRRLLAFAVDLWDAIEGGRADALIGSDLVVQDVEEWEEEVTWNEEGILPAFAVVAPIDQAIRDVLWEQRQHDLSAILTQLQGHPVSQEEYQEHDEEIRDDGTIAYLEQRLSPAATERAALAQYVSSQCRELSVAMVVTGAPGAPLRMTFQVDSLIAAMWLQLALAIDGKREYRTCPVCGRWWDSTEARSDKLTCSDKCRKSRQRAKTKEATEEAE